MSRGDIILRLVDVERIYETKEGRKIVALNKVTTSFKRGEFVGIVGKSGSGKSTLINILGGLDRPDGGDYFLEGNNISDINEGHWDAIRNEKIGFIFQEYHLVEYLSVYKNVEIALKYQKNSNNKIKDAKIKDILTKVGLIDHMHKLPSQLSGGQRQRVAIARALVKDPAIILADEPTGALDHKTSETVIDLIKGLSKERLVLVVTHDRGIANNHATRIIELSEGKFTSDLIKEDIPQTYQNTYKKTKPTNLSLRDKFELTFKKIRSQLLRTLFTALSLALAFSFTILFNGIERGVSEAYDAYYEALNKTNSFAFSLVSEDAIVNRELYESANNEIISGFDILYENGTETLQGYSPDMAFSVVSGGVEQVTTSYEYPDVLGEYKLRLIDVSNVEQYSFSDLFIGDSDYPYDFNEVMVTSKFYREYFELSDTVTSLESYVGESFFLPEYTFEVYEGIYNTEEYLNSLVEVKETGEIMTLTEFELNVLPTLVLEEDELASDYYLKVRYLHMNLPDYCNSYDDLEDHYQHVCEDLIRDDQYSRYFDSLEEYWAYMDDFEAQVNQIDPEYYDILLRSNAIYYVVDENESNELYVPPFGQYYVERVYRALYENADSDGTAYFQEGVFKDQMTMREMYVSGIIDNENESIMYLDVATYNDLFNTTDTVEPVEGYYSVNLASGITRDFDLLDFTLEYFAEPLNTVSVSTQEEYKIIRKEFIEQGEVCAIYNVDNVLNTSADIGTIGILGDVFTITDYSGCKVNSETYHYLTSIRVLFGVFFNVLMVISILFFNILLQVILSERISEIGIYRSVGSTSKDIKYLFFIEILIEVIMAAIMSIFIIYYANIVVNDVFLNTINQGSGVVNFAGMKLSLGDNQEITSISFFNLLFYIVMVFLLLGFLSNRNVSKLANTKPIDILREVD
jgi:ABC-type lipoprotein export system ATPase subunit/ABC-type antimicrobial peptide transport system permease subunit